MDQILHHSNRILSHFHNDTMLSGREYVKFACMWHITFVDSVLTLEDGIAPKVVLVVYPELQVCSAAHIDDV